jgi:hypothetical protein
MTTAVSEGRHEDEDEDEDERTPGASGASDLM